MRSHLVLRRTRSSLKPPSPLTSLQVQRALISSTHVPRYPRKEPATPNTPPRSTKRISSSATQSSASAGPDDPNEEPSESRDGEVNEQEKDKDQSNQSVANVEEAEPEKPTKRRTRTPKEPSSEASPVPSSISASSSLPPGLDVLWLPDDPPTTPIGSPPSDPPSEASSSSSREQSALPPPEVFQEVLTNFLLTLHPQTQHKAAYATSASGPVETTLAIYCPIEGGDYVIDETVRELGRRTGAEVVVLDAVQLAAGESGQFGKGEHQMYFDPCHNLLTINHLQLHLCYSCLITLFILLLRLLQLSIHHQTLWQQKKRKTMMTTSSLLLGV